MLTIRTVLLAMETLAAIRPMGTAVVVDTLKISGDLLGTILTRMAREAEAETDIPALVDTVRRLTDASLDLVAAGPRDRTKYH